MARKRTFITLNLLLVSRSVKIESFRCLNLKTPQEQCAPITRHALLVVSINSQPDLAMCGRLCWVNLAPWTMAGNKAECRIYGGWVKKLQSYFGVCARNFLTVKQIPITEILKTFFSSLQSATTGLLLFFYPRYQWSRGILEKN